MKKWIRFLSCVRTSPFSKGKEKKKSQFLLQPFQKTHRKAPISLSAGLVHARTALSGSADPHQFTLPDDLAPCNQNGR